MFAVQNFGGGGRDRTRRQLCLHSKLMFAKILSIAHFSQARWVRSTSEKIKENIRYMRIKRAKQSKLERKAKIAPAAWQEFIEI